MKLRKNFIGQDGFQWWIGVVEDRNDPEKIGRCRVRIFGTHTDDTVAIPTEDLPWAIPVYSVNNNEAFSAPKEGEYVIGFFLDGSFAQSPAILGVLPGINKLNPPDNRGFGDVRDADKIRKSPKKPAAIDYPEARTGTDNPVSGNIINDGIGLNKIIENSIILHIPLTLKAKPSLIQGEQSTVGYDHDFTQQELKQGYVILTPLETVPIYGINGIDTVITEPQAKTLLRIDIENSINRTKNSIGEDTWNTLNVAQQAGLAFHAYHIGINVDFERIGVRSAITAGDFVRAAQLISADKLKSSTGKYLLSEDSLSHIAANLFKSTPKSLLTQQRSDVLNKKNPVTAAGAGLGIQIHESDISQDADAKSLKYPIPEDLGKPSLNDFATSFEKSLIQRFRERSQIIAVGANDQSWSEPISPYNAEYPYNKAMETESGHVFEMDDTPGSERVHLAHRSGSFIEFYPSGTKVEKVVKSNYRIVMNDDHLYVAGKVNIVLESDAHVKVVGNCFLQVENNLEANVSANMNVAIGGTFNLRANSVNLGTANSFLDSPLANLYSSTTLDRPEKTGTPTNTQKYLEPDRIIRLRDSVTEENNKLLTNYLANPYSYGSSFTNVKKYISAPATSGSDLILNDVVGESLIVINDTADIGSWLRKQLVLASNGYWRETGVEISKKIQPSNPNITDLWRNLGFAREFWNLSDQTPWAIAFVNFGLKQNGYRYVQTPNPRDLEIRIEDYRFSRVNPSDARIGDVVLWSNDHTNFVYENNNGNLRFIGGSQPPYDGNIGDGRIGDVSIVDSGGAQIVTILRPSKA